MTKEQKGKSNLADTIIRICPVCGVVNPAGPSDSCPHLQLVRFEGIDESLEKLLQRVADVRVQYKELVTELRAHVMRAAREGDAHVEATQKGRVSEVETLRKRPEPLSLTNPEPPVPKTKQKHKQKKPAPPQVDPRQLAHLVREPPQGDA